MYSTILSRIRTKEEVRELIREIDTLKKSLFEDGGRGFESVLNSRIRHWVSEAMRGDWAESEIDKQKYLAKLEDKIEKLTILNLTLAFEPTNITIDKFISFIRQNVGEDVILDITHDPSIVAGALVTFKGKYRDFSLKKVFEEELRSGKGEIVKILNSQVKS